MFTNEEALRIIKEHDECFVIWATDQNRIVAIHPLPADASEGDRFNALASMSTDYEGPKKGRFLQSRAVTLQTLLDEQADTDRISKRVDIFNSWTTCGSDELIDILVNQRFHEPMDVFYGSTRIINCLYKIHGPQLTGEQLARLEQFARAKNLTRDQRTAQATLQCYLAVLQSDARGLKTFWEQHHYPQIEWSTWDAFTDAAGDLPTNDRNIIAQLIKVVESPFMFGPRYEAMVALGKIGPPSGQRAVDVIKRSIYDSSDEVTVVRNRVVARIQEPAGSWIGCRYCHRGYASGVVDGLRGIRACAACLGLGRVPNTGKHLSR